MTDYTDEQARRLLCAIYPTWPERLAEWLMLRCWKINETGKGPVNRIGDRLDDWRVRSFKRRALRSER